MGQLVEPSLSTSQIRGSNPIIDNFYLPSTALKKQLERKKSPGIAQCGDILEGNFSL